MSPRGRGRKREKVAPTAKMEPIATSSNGMPPQANKQIPLFCSVCPDAPRFSDVSHLLTHIASKGHLHHETQTKLKAHQDISAALALQQYEQWYHEYGIETLLVERLKSKQEKEAARGRCSRLPLPISSLKKPKSSTPKFEDFIKLEDHEFNDFSFLPDFSPNDMDPEMSIDYVTGPDMIALKGQIWPGMGKMDLANDEMRRTRNQRKPKSVIDRMRRASQGIGTTELVLNSDFDVERTRDVYDRYSDPEISDTPVSTVKPRSKRKKLVPLKEVPANVPRNKGHLAITRSGKPRLRLKVPAGHAHNQYSEESQGSSYLREKREPFNDTNSLETTGWTGDPSARQESPLGSMPYRGYGGQMQGEDRYGIRDRQTAHSFNPFSLAYRDSQLPPAKLNGLHLAGSAATGRASSRLHVLHDGDLHASTVPFSLPNSPFSPTFTPQYQDSPGLSSLTASGSSYQQQQQQQQQQVQPNDHSNSKVRRLPLTESSFQRSADHGFHVQSEHNPLFAQGAGFNAARRSHASGSGQRGDLDLLPPNGQRARSRGQDAGHSNSGGGYIKMEHDTDHDDWNGSDKFFNPSLWSSRQHDDGMSKHNNKLADEAGI